MTTITTLRSAQLAGAGLLLAASLGTQAALVNSYDFDTGLGDTLGNGADLVASGGSVAGGSYTFTANQGLRLANAFADTANYAIEFSFSASDSIAGYNKLIDFQDLSTDQGLYINSSLLDFYTAGPRGGLVTLGQAHVVGFERVAGTVTTFLDGALLYSYVDSNQALSAANVLNFFEDDNATGQGEAFAGSVDFIRIHDDRSTFGQVPVSAPVATVNEPATLGLVLLGLAGVASRRRR